MQQLLWHLHQRSPIQALGCGMNLTDTFFFNLVVTY